MVLEIIIIKFSCILKMMSGKNIPEPQPDSASYVVVYDATTVGFFQDWELSALGPTNKAWNGHNRKRPQAKGLMTKTIITGQRIQPGRTPSSDR